MRQTSSLYGLMSQRRWIQARRCALLSGTSGPIEFNPEKDVTGSVTMDARIYVEHGQVHRCTNVLYSVYEYLDRERFISMEHEFKSWPIYILIFSIKAVVNKNYILFYNTLEWLG